MDKKKIKKVGIRSEAYSYSSGIFFFISSYVIPSHTPALISSSARHCIYKGKQQNTISGVRQNYYREVKQRIVVMHNLGESANRTCC